MKRKFFIKRLQNFLFIMAIPILFILIVFMTVSIKQTSTEFKRECEQTASGIETNLGMVINGSIKQSETLASSMRMSMALKRALLGDNIMYIDILYLDSLRLMLNSTVNAYSYMESAYIFLDKGERVISSNNGLEVLDALSDKEWIETCRSMKIEEDSIIRRRTVQKDKIDQHDILTVYSRLLLQNGFVVFNLNVDDVKNMMIKIKQYPDEKIFLADKSGNILISNVQSDAELLPSEIVQNDFQNGWHKINGKMVLVAKSTDEDSNCMVISIGSMSIFIEKILLNLQPLILFLVLIIIITVWLAYYVTSQSFRHIDMILNMFELAEKGYKIEKEDDYNKIPKDEYDIILKNIIRVFINNSFLQLQLQENRMKQENAELMALQLQINPHFLYNTLQTIEMDIKKLDCSQVPGRMLGNVSDILKYALGPTGVPVTLREELTYLKKYVEIQEYRFGEFIVFYEVDEDVLNEEVFRLMLQPLLENSLLHGLRGKEQRGYVKVVIRKINQRLAVRVIDNGTGMDKQTLNELRKRLRMNEGSSIGLINVNRRLQLRYGEDCQLKILSKKDLCTSVSFVIPLHR